MLLLLSINAVSQQDNIERVPIYEIKIDVFSLVLSNAIDLSYEYLLNENQSIGLAVFVKLKHEQPLNFNFGFAPSDPELISYKTFSLIPYYRYYLSKKYAKGFFVESFTMYATGKDFESKNNNDGSEDILTSNYGVLKSGFGVGLKIVTRKKVVIDLNHGLGVDLSRIQNVSNGFFVRVGISAGYRF